MGSEPEITVQDELASLFEWNPPPLSRAADAKKLCPPLILPPHSFYDKHIDEQFTLRELVKLPYLVPGLVENVLGPLKSHIAADLPLPSVEDGLFECADAREDYASYSSGMIDSRSVAQLYQQTTARVCIVPACTALHLSRPSPCWLKFMTWSNMSTNPTWRYGPIQEDFTLRIGNTWKDDFMGSRMAELEDAQLTLLDEIGKRVPRMATWQILPFWKVSEDIIKSISAFKGARHFHHQRGGTTLSSTVASVRNIPLDSPIQDSFLPLKRKAPQRRSKRLSESVLKGQSVLPTVSCTKSRKISTTDGFIQKVHRFDLEQYQG